MAIQHELRYGSTSEHDDFTGGPHEITHNTTLNTVVVHDGDGNANVLAGTAEVQTVKDELTDHKNSMINSWSSTPASTLYPSEELVRTGIFVYVSKDADYTAKPMDYIFADTATNGAFTVTLPENPTAGMQVVIQDVKSNFDDANLTVARNGQTIMGLDEDMTLSTENEKDVFIFTGSDWRI